jgi:hypothetical protein
MINLFSGDNFSKKTDSLSIQKKAEGVSSMYPRKKIRGVLKVSSKIFGGKISLVYFYGR